MLIVHREEEVPGADRYLDRKTFTWKSGLTPATELVVERRFRGVPPAHSIFAPALIRETTSALKSRLANHPFTFEEEGEVDEASALGAVVKWVVLGSAGAVMVEC
eukprot:Skav234773  [mRNA]  locus=scaffold2396:336211:342209:- [translate_table: standard]